jgi:anti-sigma B factor antagonist
MRSAASRPERLFRESSSQQPRALNNEGPCCARKGRKCCPCSQSAGSSQSRIRRGPPSRCRLTPTEGKDPTELLEITVSESGGVRLLRLTGELDLAGVDQFERLLTADQTTEAATIVLDMRKLTFIDSSGLRALIMADQRVRAEGGRFIVVRGPDRVNEVLEITGVAQRIELVDEPPAG